MGIDSGVAFEIPQPVIVAIKDDSLRVSSVPTVELDLSRFHHGRWALVLDAAFAQRGAPAVILARGVACLAVAWWAQLSPRSYLTTIRGALFRSPLKIGFGQAAIAADASGGPNQRLPFPSVVASDVTPYMEELLALADGWGSRFVDTGAPPVSHPTNRSSSGTDAEDMLLGYMDLLDYGAWPNSRPPEPALSFVPTSEVRRSAKFGASRTVRRT